METVDSEHLLKLADHPWAALFLDHVFSNWQCVKLAQTWVLDSGNWFGFVLFFLLLSFSKVQQTFV